MICMIRSSLHCMALEALDLVMVASRLGRVEIPYHQSNLYWQALPSRSYLAGPRVRARPNQKNLSRFNVLEP